MRIAVLSDLHLGLPESVLVDPGHRGAPHRPARVRRETMDRLRDALRPPDGRPLDQLVLLGDFFDLSMVSFETTWESAKAFLDEVAGWGFVQGIVYVPGNHDFTMWHYFEQDLHVTRRTRAAPPKPPREFRYSVPGLLRDGGLHVPDVRRPFDGGFFRGLWSGDGRQFAVVHPNLYLLDEEGATLLTHGQSFDFFWSFLGELSVRCAGGHLARQVEEAPTLSQMVQLNYPTAVLSASALGQAGVFAGMARSIKNAYESNGPGVLLALRDRIRVHAEERLSGKGPIHRLLAPPLCRFAGWAVGLAVSAGDEPAARGNAGYVVDRRESIESYLHLSLQELREVSDEDPARFGRMVFGHTHVPTEPGSAGSTPGGTRCVNTGGWILDGTGRFRGGVAIYDDSRPVGSRWTLTLLDGATTRQPFTV